MVNKTVRELNLMPLEELKEYCETYNVNIECNDGSIVAYGRLMP